jgi:cell fate regulator YaaT (PSP1 superfamily)
MPIVPLPQFETDLLADQKEREAYEKLSAPKTLVVRFGRMKLVGEFPWDSREKPGCGSKIVVRTHRGTEIGEMLTSTCSNNGCSKSVSRSEMLKYIENSGGRDYPFFTDGRALRVATKEDMDRHAAAEQAGNTLRLEARRAAEELGVQAKIVDAEAIMGGELVTFFYASEERLDMTALVPALRDIARTRVDVRQVGARDEARLTADYERCGQYCCCKNFLKVLKPVSMKSAKIQKATLDPLKISGRCGRLMCCLRYEDETYDDLRKRLPKKRTRVGTPEGDGIVIDGQILTQLALIELDEPDGMGKIRQVAIPVENLTEPQSATPRPRPAPMDPRDSGPRGGRGPAPSGGPAHSNGPKPSNGSGPNNGPGPNSGSGSNRGPAPSNGPSRQPTSSDGGRSSSEDKPARDRRPGPPNAGNGRPGGATGPGGPGGDAARRPPQGRAPGGEINLDDIETDVGEGGTAGPGEGGADRGPDGPRGKRRRRRRRRGEGGPAGEGGPEQGS